MRKREEKIDGEEESERDRETIKRVTYIKRKMEKERVGE